MSAIKLASRYAKSLMDLTLERGSMETTMADVKHLREVIRTNNDLRVLLKSPIISPYKKLKIVEKVFDSNVSELMMAFMKIMITKGREPYLLDITDAFIILYNGQKQITPVKITSAVGLEQATIDKLVAKLKKETNIVNVELTTAINSDLIGGFTIQYGDKMLDASIAKDLNTLKKQYTTGAYTSTI